METEPRTKKEIEMLANEISEKLAELETANSGVETKISFPRGLLKRASEFRQQLWFIEDETLRRNLAYHLMLADFYKWFLRRFDIGLTAKEMLIKEAICLYGNLSAAIMRTVSKNGGFKRSLTRLRKKNVIDASLEADLKWLWGIRCREHIETLQEWEYQKYSSSDFERAIVTWEKLRKRLENDSIWV